MSGEGDKPWDRAWTVQEIRDHAANWSLAGDVGMLGYLTQLSQEIIEKTQSTTASIDSLFADLDQAQTELNNVTSSFNALAHTQFVENRVAEEEEPCAAPPPPSGETVKQPAEIAQAQVREVVRNSLAFLDEMFEKVEVPAGSDSEDDDDSSPSANGGSQVILKVINPYANRRLPHIIGTKEFEEDDTLGLVLTPSDEEQSDGEQSPVEEMPRGRNQDVSESSSECEGGGRATVSLPSDDEDADGLFSPKPPPQPPAMPTMPRPVSFADELASRLGGGGVTSPTSLPPKQPANQNAQNFPALDQREPPDLFGGDSEEEDSIFGSSRGPFSGGRGLFDDLEESGIPTVPGKTQAPAPAAPVVEPAKKATPPTPQAAATKPPTQNPDPLGDLFGDDAEDELFSAPKSTIRASSKSSVLLFSDEEDLFAAPSPRMRSQTSQQPHDLFSEPNQPLAPQPRGQGSQPGGPPPKSQVSPKPLPRARREESPKPEGEVAAAPAKKLPAGAVSIFGGQQVFPASALRRQPSSSSDEEVVKPSQPSPSKSAEPRVASKPEQASKVQPVKQAEPPGVSRVAEPEGVKPKPVSSKTASSLFDDNDSEDDLFAKTKLPESKPKQPVKSSKSQPKISLFGDSDEEDFIIPSKPKQTQSKTNLFADESSKPNLFPTEEAKSIFDEPSTTTKSVTTPKPSLFADVEPPKSQPKTVEKAAKGKVSLFNESDSEDEVLFSSASSGSSKSSKLLDASKTSTGRHGLFDDDWLFTAPKSDPSSLFSEGDDLFSTKKVSKVKNQQSLDSNDSVEKPTPVIVDKAPETNKSNLLSSETKSSVKPPTKSASKLGDLFSDSLDSPDDLFSSKPKENVVDDDLFTSKTVKSSQPDTSKKVPKNKEEVSVAKNVTENKPIDDLFGFETTSKTEDLFSTETTKKIVPQTSKNKSLDDLFGSETVSEPIEISDELFASEITKKKDLTVATKNDLFGSETISKSENLFPSEIKKDIEPQTSINKPLDDLFGSQSSSKPDEIKKDSQTSKNQPLDDLFGTDASSKSDLVPARKDPPTSKNIDDLFNSPDLEPIENIDADDLFGNTPVVAKRGKMETVTTKTEEPIEKSSEVFPSPHLEPVKSFDADDLFVTKPVVAKREKIESGTTKLITEEPIETSKSSELSLTNEPKSILLFDSDEDTDIFAPKTKVDKPVVASRKPKMDKPKPMARSQDKLSTQDATSTEIPKETLPVLDDTDGAKPSKVRSEPPNTLNVPKTPSLSSQTEDTSEDNQRVEKSKDVGASLKPEEKDKVKISPVQRGLNLNINPLALLPGGKSVKPYQRSTSDSLSSPTTPTEQNVTAEKSVPEVPSRERSIEKPVVVPEIVTEAAQVVVSPVLSPVENAVSFEETTAPNILHCPGKDRIRIQHKRKASTRRGRTVSTVSNTPSPAVKSTDPEPSKETPKPELPKPVPRSPRNYMTPPLLDREPPPLPPSNPMSPSTDEEDVFDLPSEDLGDDEDSLFKPVSNSALSPFSTTPELAVKSKINLFPDSDTSPSFASPNEEISNIDLFAEIKTSSPQKIDSPIDLFGEKNTSLPTSVPPLSEGIFTEKSNEDSLFTKPSISSQVQDDLFKNESPKATISSKQDDLIKNESPKATISIEQDDLFSEASSIVPPTLSSSKKEDDIFSETQPIKSALQDDLFGEQTAADSSSLPSKPATQIDNLFGETSTISSSPVTATLKDDLFGEKTTIEPPLKEATQKENIFGETSAIASPSKNLKDDIFGPLDSSPISKSTLPKDELFASPSVGSDLEDDLFGTRSPLDLSSKPSRQDENLFATVGKVKSSKDSGTAAKKSSSTIAAKPAAVVDLFSDPSDEDFFTASSKPQQSAPPSVKPVTKSAVKSTPKPAAKTAVVDLFGEGSDEDDLFATASRSSGTKSSTSKRTSDISKPKSETSKSVSKSKPIPAKNDDFEDPLMAFQNDD